MTRSVAALLLALAILPSAFFAYRYREMPHFGESHDDSIYFVTAKAMAEGRPYSVPSLPGEPPQTKYPPLFPALLSLVWLGNPSFPENLSLATLICWLQAPGFIALAFALFRRSGFPMGQSTAMAALLALSPFTALLGSSMLSELLFCILWLAALISLERGIEDRIGWAFAAGALAAAAYLTRSAGIVFLPAGLLCFAWRRQWKPAAAYAVPLLIAVAAWSLWVRAHLPPGRDPITLYYLNYFELQLANVDFTNFHRVLWINIDTYLEGLGSLIFADVPRGPFTKMMVQTFAVGIIIGIARACRRSAPVARHAVFAALFSLLMVIWCFPPNVRFVYPLFPLVLIGLFTEGGHLVHSIRTALRHREASQRTAARVLATAALSIAGMAVGLQLLYYVYGMPENMKEHRRLTENHRAAFSWVRANTPESAAFMADNSDASMYLYARRHGLMMHYPTRYWYDRRQDAIGVHYGAIPELARWYGLGYLYINAAYQADLTPEQHRDRLLVLEQRKDLERLFQSGPISIYRVLPQGTTDVPVEYRRWKPW